MRQDAFVINRAKGILLAYEGISGSGKSIGIYRLQRHLSKTGLKVVTVEWNANPLIRKVVQRLRQLRLLSPFMYSLLQWIGFLIDYWSVISPELKKGHIVLADRYVYTAITRDAANDAGRLIGRAVRRLVRPADMLLFYDTPPAVCIERIKSRGKVLFHTNKKLQNEDLMYLERTRIEYAELLGELEAERSTTIVFVDSRQPFEQVHQQIEAYMEQKTGCNQEAVLKIAASLEVKDG